MYGCGDACLVYGFNLNTRDIKFDDDWLYKNYPDIECYARDIVRNYLGEAIYGVRCDIDLLTGKVTGPEEKQEKMVVELYYKYLKYYNKHDIRKYGKGAQDVKLGYHLAVIGWDEEEHAVVNLDDEDESN